MHRNKRRRRDDVEDYDSDDVEDEGSEAENDPFNGVQIDSTEFCILFELGNC